jgi:hypothetical protein
MSRPRRTWREGWWPQDKEVEDYLKAKILECEPNATFFYAHEFIESLKAADEEARRKAEQSDATF